MLLTVLPGVTINRWAIDTCWHWAEETSRMRAGQAAAAAATEDDDDFAPSPSAAPQLLDPATEELVYVYLTKQALVRFPALHPLRSPCCPPALHGFCLSRHAGASPAWTVSGTIPHTRNMRARQRARIAAQSAE